MTTKSNSIQKIMDNNIALILIEEKVLVTEKWLPSV